MSLTRCIRQAKTLDPADAAEIRSLAASYRVDGMKPKEAGITAVQDVLADVVAERNELAARIEAQGGSAPRRSEVAALEPVAEPTAPEVAKPVAAPKKESAKKEPAKKQPVNQDTLLSKNKPKPTTGFSKEGVTKAITPALEALNSETDVEVVAAISDLPSDMFAPPGTRGAYDGIKIYLIAENIGNAKDANVALAHELIGHMGVHEMSSAKDMERIGATIDKLNEAHNPKMVSIVDEVEGRYGILDKRTLHAEILAVAAERRAKDGPIGRLLRQAREAVRKFLKSHGINFAFADADIDIILSNSESFLRKRPDATTVRRREMVETLFGVPADPFHKENERLAGRDKKFWDKAKTLLKKQFAPGGLLQDSIFNADIARKGGINESTFYAEVRIKRYEVAVRKEFGVSPRNLSPKNMKRLSAALSGKVDPNLSDMTRTAIYGMRQYIDNLSKAYMKILREQIVALTDKLTAEQKDYFLEVMETGNMAEDPNDIIGKIVQKTELFNILARNIGRYITRSYQAFDDPDWHKLVSPDVKNRARAYLRSRFIGSGITQAEINKRVEVIMDDILVNGTNYASLESFIRETKLGSKDLGILQQRKDIHPVIRELMGQYADPRMNFAITAHKMSHLIYNHRFLEHVRRQGMGDFLFEEHARPPGTVLLAADESEVYSPLNGLYTYRETDQALKDAVKGPQMESWYSWSVRLNGMVKGGKTVLSPTTSARNFESAAFFAMMNGHFNWGIRGNPFQDFGLLVNRMGTDEQVMYIGKLIRMGVLHDNPRAQEMMDLLKEAKLQDMFKSSKVQENISDFFEFARRIYSYGDDFWKVIGFENEKAGLIKHGKYSEVDAEVEAAQRIRNGYPTYSMVGRTVTFLRTFFPAGTFTSFPSEIIRTSSHLYRITKQDFKTPGMRPRALQRMFGMVMAGGAFAAAQALSKKILDLDDEDEEAIRIQAAPWNRNSNLVLLGYDDDGNMKYVDASFMDPYNYWKRPVTAMLRDQPIGDALKSSLTDMLSPFLGEDITFGVLIDWYKNKKESGGSVYNEYDDPLNQLGDIATHIRKGLQPGLFSNLERTARALKGEVAPGGRKYSIGDEALAWIGLRTSTLDSNTALFYRSYEFQDAINSASAEMNRDLKNPNAVSDAQLQRTYERVMRIRSRAYQDMGVMVEAVMNSGISAERVEATLRSRQVSRANIESLFSGDIPDWKPSRASRTRAVREAAARYDQEIIDRMEERYDFIDSL